MSVEIPAPFGCSLPVDWSCEQDLYDELNETDEGKAIIARSEALAWNTLRALSAYQVGSCPITVRPCARGCVPGSWLAAAEPPGSFAGVLGGGSGWFAPYVRDGSWFNACGCSNDDCSCTSVPEVVLPGPVGGISEVTIDGSVLPPTAYRVDNGNRLVRIDGGSWPICQDMTSYGEGSFLITYTQGIPVDGLGAAAAGSLAAEYAKACNGDNCVLPPNVVSITRQGVTMDIASGAFPGGVTGIREVDTYIRLVNPFLMTAKSAVYSPQRRVTRTTTWSA